MVAGSTPAPRGAAVGGVGDERVVVRRAVRSRHRGVVRRRAEGVARGAGVLLLRRAPQRQGLIEDVQAGRDVGDGDVLAPGGRVDPADEVDRRGCPGTGGPPERRRRARIRESGCRSGPPGLGRNHRFRCRPAVRRSACRRRSRRRCPCCRCRSNRGTPCCLRALGHGLRVGGHSGGELHRQVGEIAVRHWLPATSSGS